MCAQAQPRIAREVHVGVLGGTVLSNYSFAPSVTQSMAQGYTFGVGARYIEEKFFGLQTELLITRRGEKDRFDDNPEIKFQRNFTYIELPVLAHIYFNLGQKSEIALDLGPKAGFFLSDNATAEPTGEAWESIKRRTYHHYAHHTMAVSKRFDYGIQAGLGYEFKLRNNMSIQLQGRYYFGLGNMFPDSKGDVYETSNNHNIQIVAAFWFRQQIAKLFINRKYKQYSKKR